MEFDWTIRTIGEWRRILSQAPRSNWMQTWPYAEALFKRDRKQSRLALIQKNGSPLGLMCLQIIEAGPLRLIELKRGPIWFNDNPSQELLVEFAESFRQAFPKRLLQRVHWMPEQFIESSTAEALEKLGFKMRSEVYETIWLDLNKSESKLKIDLRQKWRNCLSKSLKSSLDLKVDVSGSSLDHFLHYYFIHKSLKRYKGPTQAFLSEEFRTAFKSNDAFLVWALSAGQPAAGMGITIHGNSASYRVGWNSEKGRKSNAHYLVVWRSIQILQERNVRFFDLGGVVRDEACGVNHFKEGVGGTKQAFVTLKG